MAPKVMKKAPAVGAKAKAKAKGKPRAQAKGGAAKAKKLVLHGGADFGSDSEMDEEDEAFSAAVLAEQRGLGKMGPDPGGRKKLNVGGRVGGEEGDTDMTREYLLALENRSSPLDALASSMVPAGCIARKLLQHNGIAELFLLPGLELKTLKGIAALNAGERAMVKLVLQAAPKFLKGVDTKLFGQYFGDSFNKEAVATLRSTLEGGQPVEDLSTFYGSVGGSQPSLAGRSIQVVQNFTKALRFSGVLSEAEYHDMIALGASRKLEPSTYRDMLNTETRAGFAGLGGRLVLRCTVLPVPVSLKPVKGDPPARPGGTPGGKGGAVQRALPKVWDTVASGWVTASAELLGGVCFDHISAKGCIRGRSCRFSHSLPSRFLLQEPGQKDSDSGKETAK
eukprot:g7793.t1